MSDVEAENRPDPKFHLDRASARTGAERREHFKSLLEKRKPYDAAIRDAGNEPWHKDDVEAQWKLYLRRYDKSTAVIW